MRCLQTLLLLALFFVPVASAHAVGGTEGASVRVAALSGPGGAYAWPAGLHKKHCTCPKSAGICTSQTFALEGSYGFICDLQLAAVMCPIRSSVAPELYTPELEPPPPRRILC